MYITSLRDVDFNKIVCRVDISDNTLVSIVVLLRTLRSERTIKSTNRGIEIISITLANKVDEF